MTIRDEEGGGYEELKQVEGRERGELVEIEVEAGPEELDLEEGMSSILKADSVEVGADDWGER